MTVKPKVEASVLVGDDLKTYWWRRLAATWRHGGFAAAAKQFQAMWSDARHDGALEHLELLRKASRTLSAVYEYLPQFTIAEALTIQAGREIDELIERLAPTPTSASIELDILPISVEAPAQKGDESHDN